VPVSASSPQEDVETRAFGSSTSPASTGSPAPAFVGIDSSGGHGRYLPIEELGRGGMGRVLRAYDPKLQREVALKLLHMEVVDSAGRARMVREARTMARLNHPHVVAVYDAEEDPLHGVVLVMELVKGSTLQEWLRRRPRSWLEILEAFVEAGRGLAAAHDEGLLHRDFKPANVLVALAGSDDAVIRGPFKVTDFGLAKPEPRSDLGASLDGSTPPSRPRARKDVLEALTEDGTVMGTPLYMAPEQHRGGPLTSAADQYAFCVALWHALTGKPPFLPPDLAAAKHRGPPPWPRTSPAPRTLGEALRRGLAVEPGERWPSMTTLLGELTPMLERERRRPLALLSVVGGIGLVAAAWYASTWSEQQRARERIEACAQTGEPMDSIWNERARATVRQALLDTGVSYAAATADGVMPWLDRYATSWTDARVEACMNAEVHRTWDADRLDRALWCLEERRMELESLVAELSRADATMAQMAVDATTALPAAIPCIHESASESLPPPPAEARSSIDRVRGALARAATLDAAGKYDQGLALAREARVRAQALDWPPLRIRAMALEGKLLEGTGAYAEAEQVQIAAFAQAIETGTWDVAQRSARALAFTVGVRQARPAEGWLWNRLADASGAHLGGTSEQRDVQRLLSAAALDQFEGSYAEAKASYEQALVLLRRALGPDHPRVAHVLDQLAIMESRLGNPRAAVELGEQALSRFEGALGRDHPRTASVLVNLAASHELMGAHAEAKVLYERALSIDERALGPEHPKVALDLQGYANVLKELGQHEEAVALYERALVINKAKFGPEHPRMAALLNNLANVHLARRDYEAARALYERGLSINERALGPDHPDVATSLQNVAALEDDVAKAKPLFERALAIRERTLGPRHAELARSLGALARIADIEGRHLEAIRLAERALSIVEDAVVAPAKLAEACNDLSVVLWNAPEGQGRDRDHAVALARRALAAYRSAGGHEHDATALEAWLAAHDPSHASRGLLGSHAR